MLLTSNAALAVKLLFWLLALAVFLRASARSLGRVDMAARQSLAAAVLGAVVGSKLVHCIASPWVAAEDAEVLADFLLHLASGDSAIGGVLGARLGLWFADSRERGARLADGLARPAALALLVLAIGAFFWALRGTSYGAATALPWGVDFGDGIKRHPVMIYEALALFALIRTTRAPPNRNGGATLLLMLLCAMTLLLGFLKPPFDLVLLREALQPPVPLYGRLLTAEQWVALLALLALLRSSLGMAGRR